MERHEDITDDDDDEVFTFNKNGLSLAVSASNTVALAVEVATEYLRPKQSNDNQVVRVLEEARRRSAANETQVNDSEQFQSRKMFLLQEIESLLQPSVDQKLVAAQRLACMQEEQSKLNSSCSSRQKVRSRDGVSDRRPGRRINSPLSDKRRSQNDGCRLPRKRM